MESSLKSENFRVTTLQLSRQIQKFSAESLSSESSLKMSGRGFRLFSAHVCWDYCSAQLIFAIQTVNQPSVTCCFYAPCRSTTAAVVSQLECMPVHAGCCRRRGSSSLESALHMVLKSVLIFKILAHPIRLAFWKYAVKRILTLTSQSSNQKLENKFCRKNWFHKMYAIWSIVWSNFYLFWYTCSHK